MPTRTLRFCPKCLNTAHAASCDACPTCAVPLQPLLDSHGALSRDFLSARGNCCDNGCRNCPYPPDPASDAASTKTCERCGESFACRMGGCWCESVKLGPGTLQWLQRNFTDCLCPNCLGALAAAGTS